LQNVTAQPIQEVYALLAQDEERNRLIVADVMAAVQAKRCPVLLTERREHLDTLASLLSQHVQNVIVMAGGMGKKQRQQLAEQIAGLPADQPRVTVRAASPAVRRCETALSPPGVTREKGLTTSGWIRSFWLYQSPGGEP
jgi:hypothetical protein